MGVDTSLTVGQRTIAKRVITLNDVKKSGHTTEQEMTGAIGKLPTIGTLMLLLESELRQR